MELMHGDCLELMNEISDGSVDMVLCDLPYGTTVCKWDVLIPFAPIWAQYHRICKPNAAVVLFASEPFTSFLITSNIEDYRQKLTWVKTRPTNVFNAKKQFMNWTEDICVFYRSLPTFNPQMRNDGQFTGRKVQHLNESRKRGVHSGYAEREGYIHEGNGGLFYPKSVLEFSNVHNGGSAVHPTQKPVALLEYLIKTYTNEGDLVLDNTMGAGPTGVACVNTKRDFIGIEPDQNYYDIACRRIAAAQKEIDSRLF